MPLAPYIPAIKYGNSLAGSEMDANTVGNAQLSTAISQSTTITLTSAQILALCTTPVQIVTTTVAGTMIIVDSWVFEMNPTSTTYTLGGAAQLWLGYNNNTTNGNIMTGGVPQSVVTSGSAGYFAFGGTSATAGVTVVPNAGITIGQTGNANFTVGTGTAKVSINYYILSI